jgi:hypothetical protein
MGLAPNHPQWVLPVPGAINTSTGPFYPAAPTGHTGVPVSHHHHHHQQQQSFQPYPLYHPQQQQQQQQQPSSVMFAVDLSEYPYYSHSHDDNDGDGNSNSNGGVGGGGALGHGMRSNVATPSVASTGVASEQTLEHDQYFAAADHFSEQYTARSDWSASECASQSGASMRYHNGGYNNHPASVRSVGDWSERLTTRSDWSEHIPTSAPPTPAPAPAPAPAMVSSNAQGGNRVHVPLPVRPVTPSDWSEHHVKHWLEGIGEVYGEYGGEFVRHGITGEELLDADFGDPELVELGVTSAMHRKRIMKEVRKLKQPQQQAPQQQAPQQQAPQQQAPQQQPPQQQPPQQQPPQQQPPQQQPPQQQKQKQKQKQGD